MFLYFLQLCLRCLYSFLHLADQRLRILGIREETDIIFVGNDVLLEGIVATDEIRLAGVFLLRKGLAHSLFVGFCDSILFLKRNEADSLITLFELGAGLCWILSLGGLIGLDLGDKGLLSLKISVEVVLRLTVLIPLGEEFVAGGAEALPELFCLLARDCGKFLPLLLQGDELICSFLPLGTGLQGLCLSDKILPG